MTKKNNTIRLTEEQFHQLIENAVIETLNEGRFGDIAKKAGKGLAKGLLYTGLAAGAAYGVDKGMQNQERYQQQINHEAQMLNRGNEDEIRQFMHDHNMEDNEQNRKEVEAYFDSKNESKKPMPTISEQRLARIIRENLQKVKKA